MSVVDAPCGQAAEEGRTDGLAPLILDFAESIEILYDEQGHQCSFAQTSQGTHEEPDTQGLDP